jgi:hypothetical protein
MGKNFIEVNYLHISLESKSQCCIGGHHCHLTFITTALQLNEVTTIL